LGSKPVVVVVDGINVFVEVDFTKEGKGDGPLRTSASGSQRRRELELLEQKMVEGSSDKEGFFR